MAFVSRYLVPWGFDPPFGTNKINHLQRPVFSGILKKGMTLPVTLPVATLNPRGKGSVGFHLSGDPRQNLGGDLFTARQFIRTAFQEILIRANRNSHGAPRQVKA